MQPEPAQGEPCESSADGITPLVFNYIENRASEPNAPEELMALLSQTLRRVQDLEGKVADVENTELRAAELQRIVDVLKADNEQLRETIRRLEIGFRRHVSERVSPDQLKLALKAGETVPSPDPSTPGSALGTELPPSGQQVPGSGAPSGSDPETPKQKNRHQHGRRPITLIPKVIIETLPAEVRLKGIENFERIGEEDTSMLGYRRGGPIELVFRRAKFVARGTAAKSGIDADQGSASTMQDSESEASAPDTTIRLLEHEIASAPQDTGFKSNPFVDGAIVRYTPESPDAADADCTVFIAPLAERPIARSMVDASLLANLLVGKLDYHTPYYRQEVKSARMGYPISRTNMARWQFEAGSVALRITDAMWQEALARSWFAMDATGTAIQDSPEYRYGHVFVLVAPGDGVLFRFTPKYDGDTMCELFGGFTGTIVADASANHNVLFGPGKAREGGCWAHARKAFTKALRAGEGKDAAFVLDKIQKLFRIEQGIALAGPEARLEVRQRQSAPLVKALYEWLDKRLPEVENDDTFVRKGLVYLHNQREALQEFLSNGEIPIHNNSSERALRRVCEGQSELAQARQR